MRRAPLLLALVCALTNTTSLASPQRAEKHEPPRQPTLPSLYLSCPLACFEDYLRQELSYFDFTSDPYRAEITLVIVRQQSGNGGERFTVTLTRRVPVPNHPVTAPLSFTVPANTPDVTSRKKLAQTMLRVLQRELAGTSHEEAFELSLPTRDGTKLSNLNDPWDYWTFTPELAGEIDGGSSYFWADATAGLTVRRITDFDKFRLRASYSRQFTGYELEDGSRVDGDVARWETRLLYARSLGQRWALGALGTVRASEFENLKAHVHGGPAVEFNVFPYPENASQQLRLVYQTGAWANWYLERNREDGWMREARLYHALSLIVDVNQPWGGVQWIGQVNQFIDEPRLYRVSTGVTLSLRLMEGLAINLEGNAALVDDMINLRARQVTDLELLLGTVQQPTDHTLEGGFGITYTFGSGHNTIVNPRFARVDLDEE